MHFDEQIPFLFFQKTRVAVWQSAWDCANQINQNDREFKWASFKKPGRLGYIKDFTTVPRDVGIKMDHYKDPYETSSTVESKVFFFGAQMVKVLKLNFPK